ncbi:hypothetical protein [Streptomyces sp. NPDC057682]|uniref:hypothetical protein n=1 Tax=Streptomyces sp. NPDC057682 TaxID=3346210 RepID=UPI003696309A
MRAAELATAAVGVVTGGTPVTTERKEAVQELVWGRLGRTSLGASALARLHERPGEGSASIVISVLTDELRADPAFAGALARSLGTVAGTGIPGAAAAGTGTPGATPDRPAAGPSTALPPPGRAVPGPYAAVPPPPRPVAAPAPQVPDATDVRNILLLGLPQFFVVSILIYILSGTVVGPGAALLLLVTAGLSGYGLYIGTGLLRRNIRSGVLVTAVVLCGLVLLRTLLYVVIR